MKSPHSYVVLGLFLALSPLASGCAPEGEEEAELSESDSALTTARPAKHCVVSTQAIQPGQVPAEQATAEEPRCFASLPEAVSFATRGTLRLPPGTPAQEVVSALKKQSPQALTATYVIGIEYVDANYGGGTLTFTAGGTCENYSFLASSMPPGWNDIISSALAFSACGHAVHYEHVNQGGAQIDLRSGSTYIGPALNDRTSSILWYR